jgi:hypothetical protein
MSQLEPTQSGSFGDQTGPPAAVVPPAGSGSLPPRSSGSSRPLPAREGTAGARPIPVSSGNRPIPTATAGKRPLPVATSTHTVRTAEEDELPDEATQAIAEGAPPWLVSAVVHIIAIIILGLITYQLTRPRDKAITLVPPDPEVWAEEIGEQVLDERSTIITNERAEQFKLSDSTLPEVPDPFAAPPDSPEVIEGVQSSSEIKAPDVGMALDGRQRGRRHDLLGAYGGNKLTEDAVIAALEWLARNQRPDGSWSLLGPYNGGGGEENVVAATAMALIAFQGHGDTHNEPGRFQKNVANGWKALIKFLDKQGSFHSSGVPQHHQLYTQGQATIALCEIYGMTEDPQFKEPAQRAINYIVKIQDKAGGWRYFPGDDSDTSVTGWIVMALQSARMAKLEVPAETLARVDKYLDSVAEHRGSRYRYSTLESKRSDPVMTAEALLCRQYLGWKRNDPRLVEGVRYLLQHPMEWGKKGRNVYYWYYAAQVMHHMEGDAWRKWNAVMRQMLPERQVKEGKERGSWDPDGDAWGPTAGRLYVTCLSTYMLEVYYRHLPIYTKIYGDGFVKPKQ